MSAKRDSEYSSGGGSRQSLEGAVGSSYLDPKKFQDLRGEISSYLHANMNVSSNARFVADGVYDRRLEDGSSESFEDRVAGIAIDIASADLAYLPSDLSQSERDEHVASTAMKYAELYADNLFRANTPTNLNMGRLEVAYNDRGDSTGLEYQSQMGSACFVLPVEDTFGKSADDLDGILESWVIQQQLHKGGGGTGFSFSSLRPKGSLIGYNPSVDGMSSFDWDSNRGVSSGYGSFLDHFFNEATDAVKQGNSRRGANMGVVRIDHMDFLSHMYAKTGTSIEDGFKIKNFNLSYAIPDGFMEAVEDGGTFTLYNPQRAEPRVKKILEERHGVKDPEVVRKGDLATRAQFETILDKNTKNPFAPLTTPDMYLDDDGTTVVNAYTGRGIGTVVNDIVHIDARSVMDIFAESSHSNGEPGAVFIDRVNEMNAVLYHKEMDATNPCGEQPLVPYEACNLGSINLGEFVRHESGETLTAERVEGIMSRDPLANFVAKNNEIMYLDWESLDDTIRTSTRFLDGVIDRSEFPSSKVTEAVENTRKIGLGYMGVADAMMLMKIRYGSEESFEFGDAVAKRLHDVSLEESVRLADERGEFPLWDVSFYNSHSDHAKWFSSNDGKPKEIVDRFRGTRELSDRVDREHVMDYDVKVRNACRTTQAPTGTIRRTTGQRFGDLDDLAISSGIEPMFSLHEVSNILNAKVEDTSLAAVKLLEREGLPVEEIVEAIRDNNGSVFEYSFTKPEVAEVLRQIPDDVRNVMVTAAGGEGDVYEIQPDEHVKMMTTFQRWNDSAISKTMNLPPSSSVEDMAHTWMDIWKQGGKGGTVYRDGSRDFQILETAGVEGARSEVETKFRRTALQSSFTIEMPYVSGSSVGEDEGNNGLDFNPERVFTTITMDPSRERITGVFQNVPEFSAETYSLMTRANIDLSGRLKEGRSLDEVIADVSKTRSTGGRLGRMVDQGVMDIQGVNEPGRHSIEGATSSDALLKSLYVVKFLTQGGKDFDPLSVEERRKAYIDGEATIKTIVNTGGDVDLVAQSSERPSLLGSGKKVLKAGDSVPPELCPECM